MRTTKIISSLVLLSVAFLFTTCERERYGCTDPRAFNYDVSADIDDGSCYYENEPGQVDCLADFEGNLVVSNRTGEKLYLYKNYVEGSYNADGAFITCIPADTSDFLIYISNQDLEVCLLQIWKASDVSDIDEPDLLSVHRQWRVALSNSTDPAERANWLITGSDEVTGTGTLFLSYPDMDDYGHEVIYQVDILLNSKTGAKLASLQPGISNKKVSVDYGVHFLYYHYWYSDPNSSTGEVTDIGWTNMPDIVINESHKEAEIEIPVFYSSVGKLGELTVINHNDYVINVYAGDNLIEDIAVVEGSTQGLSSIPPGDQTTFVVPVEDYVINTKDLAGKQVDHFAGVSVLQEENAVIQSGTGKRTITINNATDVTLGLFNLNEEFLGLKIDAGKTSVAYTIPAMYDSLLVIDFARLKLAGFNYASSVTISELENYMQNNVVMDSPWPKIDDYYESPLIEDEETTSMLATLVNAETVVLSFEYNVSSENGYDEFRFKADGFTELTDISGETGWVVFSKSFAPGTHSLEWIYAKDQTRAEGRDNVQIRNIVIE